jgi:hypothetical protein
MELEGELYNFDHLKRQEPVSMSIEELEREQ